MTLPYKIWASEASPGYGEWQDVKDGLPAPTPYHRAPTTLDEALRDYAMFGKWCEYMASSFDDYGQHTIGTFVVGWTLWRMGEASEGEVKDFDAYRAFVKEEMGK